MESLLIILLCLNYYCLGVLLFFVVLVIVSSLNRCFFTPLFRDSLLFVVRVEGSKGELCTVITRISVEGS